MDMVTLVMAAGRDTAWARWEEYLPRLPAYADECQKVEPGHPRVSRLSPALRHRLLLEHELVSSMLGRHRLSEVEAFVERLYRRLYAKAWLQRRPGLWRRWRESCLVLGSRLSPEQTARMQALEQARSGCHTMDFFARELVELGYLHDQARRWFAFWWVHVEGLPWELGAQFFHRHLLDADAACNLIGWHRLAEQGAVLAVSRAEIMRHCAPEIVGDGAGLDRLTKGVASAPPEPAEEMDAREEAGCGPPEPAGRSERLGVWLHPEDLMVEHSCLASLRPVAVAGFLPQDILDVQGYSVARRAFEEMALEDGLERAGGHFSCEVEGGVVSELAEAVGAWAMKHGVSTVVALHPFVGEWEEAATKLRHKLDGLGIGLRLYWRPEDLALARERHGTFKEFWDARRAALA